MTEVTADTLSTIGDDYEQLSTLYQIDFLITRMFKNSINYTGTTGEVKVVSDVNLYALAAELYGDANQWTVIAEANELRDPQICGVKALVIPKWDGIDRGGEFAS